MASWGKYGFVVGVRAKSYERLAAAYGSEGGASAFVSASALAEEEPVHRSSKTKLCKYLIAPQ